MRHLIICSLLCLLPAPTLAQATPDWANRLTAKDPKTRAIAEAALVNGAGRSLPLLRALLNRDDEALDLRTIEIIRRIGPPAIPLLVELLRHDQVSFRRNAADALIDLAPDTESIQPALRQALKDEDSAVAGDAARALGALGPKASPSVRALVTTLSHEDPYARVYAAEALASIGPKADVATEDLARALADPAPGVRWAAAEALASIGPAAHAAVPQLIEALKDEFLYVRICAAGALGSLGPKAQMAREALRLAANDPALRDEAEWALSRIAGVESREPVVSPVVPVPSVALAPKTTTGETGDPPIDWDVSTGRNIAWSVELGNPTYGRPVVAGDTVYVGTDNFSPRNPDFEDESGVLMAFRATDGAFLWQDVAPRVDRGMREFLLPSTTSTPLVEGDRLFYVTADCQLRSLDTQGFRDGENTGPYREEVFQDNAAADIAWELDMCSRLGVFLHEASNSDVVPVGDLLMVSTSNGQNEGHLRVPSPRAPSLIAVDKHSGEVIWRAIGAGGQVLHGQWSSPVAANVNGRMLVLFGGGDGWLRAYDAASGHEVWRFDGNPKDARWLPRPGVLSRDFIIASPVFADGRVFIAMGQSPGHGNGPSLIHAISPNGQGDVTGSRLLWTSREVGRVVGTPIVKDGLLYVVDLGGTVHCLDVATGAHVWKHETNEETWGCVLLAGDRLYVGTVEGNMTVLRAGRRKELLAQIEMDAPLYSRPAVVGDALYLATARRLYAIAAKPSRQ
jgi:outer membrane protein assembly factor BamB/HEAT repeat protein